MAFFGKKSSRTAVSTVGRVFFFFRDGVRLGASLLCCASHPPTCRTRNTSRTGFVRFGKFQCGLCALSGSTLTDHADGRDRRGIPHPHLLRWLHVGRSPPPTSLLTPPTTPFFTYLNLFMFFMLTLILANNYLLMFIGWEGGGWASYLLIGFWFTKDSAASAGKKSVHRQPHWRLRIPDRAVPDHSHISVR